MYKIKYWHGSAPTIQLGVLQSKTLRISIMLTKFSMPMGIKLSLLLLIEMFGFTKIMAIVNGLVVKL